MEKDWTGNSSFFIQNHRKKESEVSENDYYSTHQNSIRSFLNIYKLQPGLYWEPACGGGNICKVLYEFGYEGYASDLINRGFGNKTMNFLLANRLPKDDITTIITNPPYKYSEEFLNKSMQLLPNKGECIMFLPLTFLEGKNRYNLFQIYKPKKVFIHSSRQGCSPTGEWEFKNGGARAYVWAIWEKGYNKTTVLEWIPPN